MPTQIRDASGQPFDTLEPTGHTHGTVLMVVDASGVVVPVTPEMLAGSSGVGGTVILAPNHTLYSTELEVRHAGYLSLPVILAGPGQPYRRFVAVGLSANGSAVTRAGLSVHDQTFRTILRENGANHNLLEVVSEPGETLGAVRGAAEFPVALVDGVQTLALHIHVPGAAPTVGRVLITLTLWHS